MKLIILLSIIIPIILAEDKTECQRHRERELENDDKIHLIPKCDENGDYEGLQCHAINHICQCWNKAGHPLTAPSKALKACECIREKASAEKDDLLGSYIPQCKEDGTYERKQCWGSTGTCWCVDEKGTKTTEPKREEIECPE